MYTLYSLNLATIFDILQIILLKSFYQFLGFDRLHPRQFRNLTKTLLFS